MAHVIFLISRYLLPVTGLAVLIACCVSLLKQKFPAPPGAYLINTANGDKLKLTHWENSIGRNSSNDIVLGYNTVSRYHAVVSCRRESWILCDTNSSTGVTVNGETIKKKTQIVHGDKISIGGALLIFETDEAHKNDVSFTKK